LRVPVRITGAKRLGNGHRKQADRTGAYHDNAFPCDEPAEFGQAVHGGAGGDHKRRFRVAHGAGHSRQRVDVVHGIFGEPAIGGEAIGAMTLLGFPIVEAGGVHALAASLALAAAGMDFHADAFPDFELVDVRSECGDRAHIFMAGREILVERQATPDAGRRAAMDDFEVSCADGNGVDAHQHFGASGDWRGFVAQDQLVRVAQDPGLHLRGGREIREMF
jgi:hypothetical protein